MDPAASKSETTAPGTSSSTTCTRATNSGSPARHHPFTPPCPEGFPRPLAALAWADLVDHPDRRPTLSSGPRRGTRHRPRAALAGRHPRAATPRRRSHSGRRRLGPRIRRRIHGHTALTRGATRTRLTDSSAPSARPARAGRRPRVCGSGARLRHPLRTNGGRHTPPVDHARRALLRDRAVRAPRLHRASTASNTSAPNRTPTTSRTCVNSLSGRWDHSPSSHTSPLPCGLRACCATSLQEHSPHACAPRSPRSTRTEVSPSNARSGPANACAAFTVWRASSGPVVDDDFFAAHQRKHRGCEALNLDVTDASDHPQLRRVLRHGLSNIAQRLIGEHRERRHARLT